MSECNVWRCDQPAKWRGVDPDTGRVLSHCDEHQKVDDVSIDHGNFEVTLDEEYEQRAAQARHDRGMK